MCLFLGQDYTKKQSGEKHLVWRHGMYDLSLTVFCSLSLNPRKNKTGTSY